MSAGANQERLTENYSYDLPPELVAQAPAAVRDAARLMIVRERNEDARFADLPQYLRTGDVLVLNETRVIAARLIGKRLPGGGRAELLLLHPAGSERYDA
ncbi:MAG: S-adenosylmethionine:tRNA ribosyltransferase-isomerase, partial [Candidatus Tumulicola sp.]